MFLEFISLLFLIFTSLLGICALIWLLASRLFDQRLDARAALVVPLRGKVDNVEYLLQGCLQKKVFPVVAVDYGVDEETRKIVEALAQKKGGLLFLPPEKLDEWLASMGRSVEDAK